MFDVGFWELVILFGLGLVFLGPERLPKVAVQVGNWVGRARRMARNLSSQIRDEIDDLDMKEPFSTGTTGQAQPTYNRPGVDDLKPATTTEDADSKATSQSSDADAPTAARPVE